MKIPNKRSMTFEQCLDLHINGKSCSIYVCDQCFEFLGITCGNNGYVSIKNKALELSKKYTLGDMIK